MPAYSQLVTARHETSAETRQRRGLRRSASTLSLLLLSVLLYVLGAFSLGYGIGSGTREPLVAVGVLLVAAGLAVRFMARYR